MLQRTIPTRECRRVPARSAQLGSLGRGDQRGAINLITPEKRRAAAQLVRTGRSVSLSRPWAKVAGTNNPNPAQHWMRWFDRGTGGAAIDFYGILYHGFTTTHIDALCHVWDENGMWNGRTPQQAIDSTGAKFGDVDQWREGIITRGVLLDVPRHRGEPFVTLEKPVHGWELEEIAAAQGVSLQPGDALLVYSGRERWHAANPQWTGGPHGPGLHASCLPFIRDNDVAVLGWDLMDAQPNEYNLPWTVHGVIFAYGVALLDNALLQPLAEACAAEGRHEFMLTIALAGDGRHRFARKPDRPLLTQNPSRDSSRVPPGQQPGGGAVAPGRGVQAAAAVEVAVALAPVVALAVGAVPAPPAASAAHSRRWESRTYRRPGWESWAGWAAQAYGRGLQSRSRCWSGRNGRR